MSTEPSIIPSAPGRFPTPLGEGDLIKIISPASPIDEAQLSRGIEQLMAWGYVVEISKNATARHKYLAGSDDQRSKDLVDALMDPRVKGIICSRGGYGSLRLLRHLPWNDLRKLKPKYFSGFSDIGALQYALWQRCGWITYSGLQVANGIGSHIKTEFLDSFQRTLSFDPEPGVGSNQIAIQSLSPIRKGDCNGNLAPICLSMLTSMIGTKFAPTLSGTILCLEDVAEPPYKIDRQFWQLANSGQMEQISALVLGVFTNNDDVISDEAMDLAEFYFGGNDYPIYCGLQYGHLENRWTLPIGAAATIQNDRLSIS